MTDQPIADLVQIKIEHCRKLGCPGLTDGEKGCGGKPMDDGVCPLPTELVGRLKLARKDVENG
jgi:hypothetical protein